MNIKRSRYSAELSNRRSIMGILGETWMYPYITSRFHLWNWRNVVSLQFIQKKSRLTPATANIENIPTELLLWIFKVSDICTATCLGLKCPKLYEIYYMHQKVSLEECLIVRFKLSFLLVLQGTWMMRGNYVYGHNHQKFIPARRRRGWGRASKDIPLDNPPGL